MLILVRSLRLSPFVSPRTQQNPILKLKEHKHTHTRTGARTAQQQRAAAEVIDAGGAGSEEAGGGAELMAEEASAPEQPRGRLHGVQREPHKPAAGQGDGGLPPASGSFRWPGGPARG
jgi:hypothetical protein